MKHNITLLILAAILVIDLFMRGWQFRERFMYNHDNDLSSWIVRDIVVNHHYRLIGQQTSEPGIFIGPLFYYLLIPFYLLFNLDPLGGIFLSLIIGIAAVVSIYFVFRRLYGSPADKFTALLYAASFAVSLNERDVVPTTPVMLWSIWFFYVLNLLFRGEKPLLLVAVLFALVWHLNLALVLLAPLVVLGIVIHIRNYKVTDFVAPVLLFLLLSLPLLVFEARHNFVQSRALVSSLTRIEAKSGALTDKFGHVFLYAAKNSTRLVYWDWPDQYSVYLIPLLLLVTTSILAWRRVVPRSTLVIYFGWVGLYAVFFAAHPINLSEYYLNGMNILTFASFGFLLSWVYRHNKLGKISALIITLGLVIYNLNIFWNSPINHSGYVERTAVVNFIKSDAGLHHYPCVSVSYITTPGYNLGYRYLFWRSGLRVNQPMSGSPVYTIVFPHPLVDHLDRTFGALGLIYPDYSKYNSKDIASGCAGPDHNITDPMFGFVN